MSSTLAPSTRPAPVRAAYDRDVYAWALEQARLIRERRFDELDIPNVAEEIESVGRAARSELRSRLFTLVEHLLKLEASSATEPRRGWERTVARSRLAIGELLEESPSLRREVRGMLAKINLEAAQFSADQLEDAGDHAAAVRARFEAGGFTDAELFGGWFPEPHDKR